MAALYVSEYANLGYTSNGVIEFGAAAHEWVTDQTVAIGASSAASEPFNVATGYIMLAADHDCSIAWTNAGEATNDATASGMRIAANAKPTMFGVTAGMLVSVITNS